MIDDSPSLSHQEPPRLVDRHPTHFCVHLHQHDAALRILWLAASESTRRFRRRLLRALVNVARLGGLQKNNCTLRNAIFLGGSYNCAPTNLALVCPHRSVRLPCPPKTRSPLLTAPCTYVFCLLGFPLRCSSARQARGRFKPHRAIENDWSARDPPAECKRKAQGRSPSPHLGCCKPVSPRRLPFHICLICAMRAPARKARCGNGVCDLPLLAVAHGVLPCCASMPRCFREAGVACICVA